MNPKNTPLLRLALVLNLAGLWLFGISLYWVMMVMPTTGAKLVGYLGWGLGILSVVLLIVALTRSPRPRRVRPAREGSLPKGYYPHKLTATSCICLSLSILLTLAGLVLTLTDYWQVGGLLLTAGGLFGSLEKHIRTKRNDLYEALHPQKPAKPPSRPKPH